MVIAEIFYEEQQNVQEILRVLNTYAVFKIEMHPIPKNFKGDEKGQTILRSIERYQQILTNTFSKLDPSYRSYYYIDYELANKFYMQYYGGYYSFFSRTVYNFDFFPMIAVDGRFYYFNSAVMNKQLAFNAYNYTLQKLCMLFKKEMKEFDFNQNLVKQVDFGDILEQVANDYKKAVNNWIRFHPNVPVYKRQAQIAEELALSEDFVAYILGEYTGPSASSSISSSGSKPSSESNSIKTDSALDSNQIMTKLNGLIQISSRVKVEEAASVVNLSRQQLLNFILENRTVMGNIKLDGDYIVVEPVSKTPSFADMVGKKFDNWQKNETTKDGKK
jgi:hypothetical protein